MRFGIPIKTRAKTPIKALWPERPQGYMKRLIWIAVAGYFVYHVTHGDVEMLGGRELSRQVAALEEEYAALTAQRRQMEHRVFLLLPDSLDPDMLDEQARRSIGFADPSEIIIFYPPPG